MPQIVVVEEFGQFDTARELFREYRESIEDETCFDGFEAELRGLPDHYAPPRGVILLAELEGRFVGCVGAQPLEDTICEVRRLYVRPEAQGAGLGRQLLGDLIEWARSTGYQRMRLDTLPDMAPAQALYRSLGFQEIERYNDTDAPGVVFMELRVSPT